MKTYRQILTESIEYIAHHNTDKKSAKRILSNGWSLSAKVKRKKLFGNGIYFSEQPNTRWGDTQISVRLKPKRPLLDFEGNIKYEDNPLGRQIEKTGQKLFKDFSMTNNSQITAAIERHLKDNKYDMLATQEFGMRIYVVRDPKIIQNQN